MYIVVKRYLTFIIIFDILLHLGWQWREGADSWCKTAGQDRNGQPNICTGSSAALLKTTGAIDIVSTSIHAATSDTVVVVQSTVVVFPTLTTTHTELTDDFTPCPVTTCDQRSFLFPNLLHNMKFVFQYITYV